MYEKWVELEIFNKNLIVSFFYSILGLIISLILLSINTSYLYGTLLGLFILWLSNGIIWLLWFKIKKIKTFMTKIIPVGILFIRLVIFAAMFLLVILVINPMYDHGHTLNIMLNPINNFALLIAYSIPFVSYFTIYIIDTFKIKKTNKKKGKENK